MTHFEYIMVMVSIIQGLGITLALRGISRLIRSPRREPAVVLWAIFMIFLYLQNWWAFWDGRDVVEWNFLKFMFIASFVCVMYAMTELMLPMAAPSETDWQAHFKSVRKWFFGMTIILVFLGVIMGVYLTGVPLMHPYRIMQFTILLLAIAGWLTPNIVAHRWIAGAFIVVMFIGQVLFRLLPGQGE